MGEEGEDVLTSTEMSSADKKYDPLVSKLHDIFKVRRNTIFERAKFNRRNQLEGESAEQHITALYGGVTIRWTGLLDSPLASRTNG